MQAFSDFFIENITNCDSNDLGAGIKANLYFAPTSFFSKIDLPAKTNFQESLLISLLDVELISGKEWNVIECLVDENELKVKLQGNLGRKRIKPSLEVYILGLRAKILGFLEILKNEDLVFMIETNDGISVLFGTLINPAKIEAADGSTAKKYEDNSGVSISLTTNASVYFFREKLVINPTDSIPINFTSTYGFIDDSAE